MNRGPQIVRNRLDLLGLLGLEKSYAKAGNAILHGELTKIQKRSKPDKSIESGSFRTIPGVKNVERLLFLPIILSAIRLPWSGRRKCTDPFPEFFEPLVNGLV